MNLRERLLRAAHAPELRWVLFVAAAVAFNWPLLRIGRAVGGELGLYGQLVGCWVVLIVILLLVSRTLARRWRDDSGEHPALGTGREQDEP